MTPVNDDPNLPEEDAEPLPPVGHVRIVYLGPVAPHWEVRSDFGDPGPDRGVPPPDQRPPGAAAPARPAVPSQP